jgi:hypothetical protein
LRAQAAWTSTLAGKGSGQRCGRKRAPAKPAPCRPERWRSPGRRPPYLYMPPAKPVDWPPPWGAPCRPARPCNRVARQPAPRARPGGPGHLASPRPVLHETLLPHRRPWRPARSEVCWQDRGGETWHRRVGHRWAAASWPGRPARAPPRWPARAGPPRAAAGGPLRPRAGQRGRTAGQPAPGCRRPAPALRPRRRATRPPRSEQSGLAARGRPGCATAGLAAASSWGTRTTRRAGRRPGR